MDKIQITKLKALLRTKSDKELLRFLEGVYANGFADGAKSEPIDLTTKYVPIKDNTSYEVICPHCGEIIVLDMADFAENDENPVIEQEFK